MAGGSTRRVALWATLVAVAAVTLWFSGLAAAAVRTYTTDADFDEGVLIGVQHEAVHDQLQPSTRPMMMPFIWVPNDGDGTISKVNTDTGQEVGRYRVSPHPESLPSRTTVDLRGDCWVGCRQAGTVVKIGLYEAGEWVDRNGDGICQTSYDANADGDITGDELLPWGQDECVLFEVVLVPGYEGTYVPGTYTGPYDYEYWGVAPRSLAVDASNNLWAGTWATSKFYYVDGATGAILKTVDVSPWGHNGYGAVMDRNGVVWSSSAGGAHVLKLDPRTNPPTLTRVDLGRVVYGVGVDYLGHLFVSGAGLARINVDTNAIELDAYHEEMPCCRRGVVCTADNDVWIGNTGGNAVYRFDNDGNLKASIPAAGPAGVAVDSAGKIWIGDLGDEFIHRVDPATNTIELSKQILGSGSHYTYSDMTGVVSWSVTTKQGTWNVVHDSGSPGAPWGTVSWNGEEPEGSSISVEVRSSEDEVDWSNWEMALNETPLVVTPSGRYLEVRVALQSRYGAAGPPILYDLTVESHAVPLRALSHSAFEESASPWSVFAAGPGDANTWRRALMAEPLAHSGTYAMSAEMGGEGATGLALALPTDPTGSSEVTLRAWAYVDDRTVGDAGTFFGLVFGGPLGGNPLDGSVPALGWIPLSDTTSQLVLLGTEQPTSVGLPAGDWRLVQLRHNRASGRFALWVDGRLVMEEIIPSAVGASPSYAVICAGGLSPSAVQHVYLDDVTISLIGHPTPTETRAFALLDGPEEVVTGETAAYTVECGNGYPVLGTEDITGTLPESIYVGVSLPQGYTFGSANPAPSRLANGSPVWEFSMPEIGQAGPIYLEAATPSSLAVPAVGQMWAWATADPAAAGVDPPDPPGVTFPPDPVWGAPQDLLPQQVELAPRPDVWVRKQGPRFAAPGDDIIYAVTTGNCGVATAADVTVRDLMPALLGGGDRILANLDSLDPGQTWTGIVSGTLPWGLPGGTLVLNTAYVPTAPMESVGANNTATCTTTIQAAHDPNEIINSPFGGADRRQQLTYVLHCENTGAGTAYGVYATCVLANGLDADALQFSNPALMRYDPVSRTIVWEVGKLGPGVGATASFRVNVTVNARRARPIVEQAVVYFPSVPETTATNVVFNVVNSTFSDIPWDHWSILQIEQTYENGIVKGYDNGTYRPAFAVTRDQMATYVARSLAGGDDQVPDGPIDPTFPDVPTDHWAYKYVEYTVAANIVVGYDDGTYRPAVPVDRGQMAVYIARALAGGETGVPPPPADPSFSDVGPGTDWEWCYPHVEYIAGRGIAGGYEDGTYRPATVCTRDQLAVYVARAFRLPL